MQPYYTPNDNPIPRASGIYRITCNVTSKFYIGSATNLYQRWNEHCSELRRNIHSNPKLQYAWNKYGPDAFTFEVLELVLIPELLTAREQYWFKTLKPFGHKGFNIDRIAGSRLGSKHSAATREKMRIAGLGNTRSLGRKLSPEVSAKLHAGNIGNTYSLGRKESPETLARRSAAHLGKKHSPETRAKMSAVRSSEMKTLIATAPDGTEYYVCGVKAFCREHHLYYSSLINVAKGKHSHHRGWTARFPGSDAVTSFVKRERDYASICKTYILTSPDGVEHVVHRLPKFCKEHQLHSSSIIAVAKGQYNQHHGWKARYPETNIS